MNRLILFASVILSARAGFVYATPPDAFASVQTVHNASYFMRSVRDAGMACSGVADPTAPGSVAANPANAVGGVGPTLFFQHDDFLRDFSTSDYGARYRGAVGDLPWLWGVTLHHQHWKYDSKVEERTVYLPEGTGSAVDFDDQYTTLTAAGAWQGRGFLVALGVSARYERTELGSNDLSGWTFNVGTRGEWTWVSPSEAEITLRGGVAVVDLDNGLRSENYDVTYLNLWRFGGGIAVNGGGSITHPISRRPVRAASIAINLESMDMDRLPGENRYGVGIELGLAEMLYLRGGTTATMRGFADGTTWGLGLATDAGPLRLRADVARYPLSNFFNPDDDSTIFGFSVAYQFDG